MAVPCATCMHTLHVIECLVCALKSPDIPCRLFAALQDPHRWQIKSLCIVYWSIVCLGHLRGHSKSAIVSQTHIAAHTVDGDNNTQFGPI